ncbi:cation:proton antiporter [Mycobacterium sp. CBMA293]|uniref:cation:proton antiporter n=1 Tax=unclassified Mycolicibacterium TaxID=2636767 RepID=UPI0012DCD081|nr:MULTISPECIES: cation:proton antiporter [unclassified Mycolicibacterium]MUL49277.1 cation:proton antiporter [Mycolicibacterium sp. CBMA 360]MUL58935.1 cation:proton antiporter [Mycolicibacterium sp. CBMA 335]MUL69329.1 cation:proton antiporter [Mycolicibacterium sp. CBMA 311]MUL94293.1 cation:proton antiporter [Mycolicibacterium sp. CBMA 230]MUM04065.1 sodium:proton antiporter [Mycolicibacterium sp. CBMA 213]
MGDFGFHALALLAVIGLAGPLFAAVPRLGVPVIVGELVAGIVVGRTGFGLVDADNPTFAMLADIGFALVMFIVGTHVPVRDQSLRGELPKALLRAVMVGVFAAVLGVVIAHVFRTGHAPLYAVLMVSSSAALALPVIQSLGLTGPPVLSVTAQIAIADAASIVLLPLAINPAGASRAAVGALAIAACAVLLYFLLRYEAKRGWLKRMHKYSQSQHLALELRISLIVLFSLAALAKSTHVSIMLAGFALGLCLSAVGEPRRLARQLFGITEGFFAPLFFVWLGASLQVRELGQHPGLIGLGVALGLGAVLAHLTGRLFGQPMALGVLASAQLGVPVAAATLGTQQHLLSPGEPSALILGALLTVVGTSAAGAVAKRRQSAAPAESGAA